MIFPMKFQMCEEELILRFEVGMLKFLIPVEQQCVMEGWMTNFALEKMRWRMMMRKSHCEILQWSSLPFSFWVKSTQ